MSITDILYTVIAGGLLGALGQGIRIAVGLKKLSDYNAQQVASGNAPEKMDTGRLWVSIFIGFVAGAIGMIIKGASLKTADGYQTEAIVTIIAIGYAGADFIEGFFQTYFSKVNAAAPVTITATPPVTVSVEKATSSPVSVDEEPELVADEYTPQHNNALG
ncbi:hypothetical protein [Chitinophaga sancti]|uniref:Uncharacterized protein n=1 Tax=Chitinophaga sancti TaxID=1004 RepID=A0A1K1PSV3_9BACT|nr:hypothetical protein [Chitinophaga sancti]WQD61676.1 hypothetical protein U0033_27730 [Chitinophaga sancti]WQG92767.1 hypothetical protein SR876_14710 [Chitinophaga sancti]SFW50744.1 hypothetical protein SAMN05661012_02193 [Chitinophaga sancti]